MALIHQSFNRYSSINFVQVNEFVRVSTTSLPNGKDERVIAIRVARLNQLCQEKGVTPVSEAKLRNWMSRFNAGKW